jgi:hypothetical protein
MSNKLESLIEQRDRLQEQINELVKTERAELKQQMRMLDSLTGKNNRPANSMSPEARAKISEAQTARWAKVNGKKAAKTNRKAKPKNAPKSAISAATPVTTEAVATF